MRRWDGLVDKYIGFCESRGLADSTIYHRSRELERFGLWLKRRRPKPNLERVDGDLVVKFLRERTAFRSKATLANCVTTLRGMGEFLVQEGVWAINPLRWIRGPKLSRRRILPKRIDRSQLQALWQAAHGRQQVHARYQMVCLLAILYATGIRNGELERLKLSDWNADSATLTIDGRKNGRQRAVAVGKGVWRCIEAYLPHRHNHLERFDRLGEPALVVNGVGRRVTRHSVWSMMRRLADRAGVARVTIHQFRHSCASDLIEAGVPLPQVQEILGHKCIQSTVRYVDIADPSRAAAIKKHPVNQFLAPIQGQEAQ
jgi:integrase/recombinase XerD